jgi:hypothetical protein
LNVFYLEPQVFHSRNCIIYQPVELVLPFIPGSDFRLFPYRSIPVDELPLIPYKIYDYLFPYSSLIINHFPLIFSNVYML